MPKPYKLKNPVVISTGDIFDKLTVVKLSGKRKGGERLYECRCDCGGVKITRISALRAMRACHCGCRNRKKNHLSPYFKGFGEISSTYWSRTRGQALSRNLDFKISISEAWELALKQNRKCALTGVEITFGPGGTASLDRKDSERGYVKSNVQWVHKIVNRIKVNLDETDLLLWCKRIVDHAKKRHGRLN